MSGTILKKEKLDNNFLIAVKDMWDKFIEIDPIQEE